jgi:thiosulfate reductase cytochrome b subunit
MTEAVMEAGAKAAPRKRVVRRHALLVRLTHWANLISLVIMLMSGLNIFNAHPALYWGKASTFSTPWLSMKSVEGRGITQISEARFDTTGVFGRSKQGEVLVSQGFPSWSTLPATRDLASARNWHLFFAWVFVINGLIYLLTGLFSRHLQRDVLPSVKDITNLHKDPHLRLKFSKGESSLHYHPMQRIAYSGMALVVLPLIVLTGMTMSPALNSVFPFLLDVFGGRQSARSIHFICMVLIVLFVIVHVLMVVLSGPINQLRGMITGKVSIEEDKP